MLETSSHGAAGSRNGSESEPKSYPFFGGSLIATTVSWLDFSATPWNGDSKLRDPITSLTMSFAS